jgi:hypothetical protein
MPTTSRTRIRPVPIAPWAKAGTPSTWRSWRAGRWPLARPESCSTAVALPAAGPGPDQRGAAMQTNPAPRPPKPPFDRQRFVFKILAAGGAIDRTDLPRHAGAAAEGLDSTLKRQAGVAVRSSADGSRDGSTALNLQAPRAVNARLGRCL